ncbi:MAG: hypothetical protein M0C28_47455, partial [Candidatus Moduliflexus flocculans]|nr:hypothetical protein [Candidatus Moduliflexus flocculans]
MARAVPLGFEKGLNVEVLVLPDDLDPDAFLKKHGRDKYQALLKKTVSGLDFLVDALTAGARMSVPEEKGKDRPGRRPGDREGPRPHRPERIPAAGQRQARRRRGAPSAASSTHRAPDKGPEEAGLFCPAEKRLFQILMADRALAPDIFAECDEEIFQGLRSEPVFRHILESFKNDADWSFPSLQGKVPLALLSQLAQAMFEKASARLRGRGPGVPEVPAQGPPARAGSRASSRRSAGPRRTATGRSSRTSCTRSRTSPS